MNPLGKLWIQPKRSKYHCWWMLQWPDLLVGYKNWGQPNWHDINGPMPLWSCLQNNDSRKTYIIFINILQQNRQIMSNNIVLPRLRTTRPPAAGATRWPWASWARWPGAEATVARSAASPCWAPASTGGSSSAARTPTELCCDNYNSLLIYFLSCVFIVVLL